jgi:YbbR domain-containing protein
MKFFRQIFTQNIGLKFFSLVLAFAVWRMITGEDIAEVGFNVPLELRNIPDRVEVVGEVVNSVSVRVRTSSAIIKHLSSADMFAFIDLAHPEMGEHTYPLTSKNVQVLPGVEVVRLFPTHVKLRLEKTVRTTLPVKVLLRGTLPGSIGSVRLDIAPKEVSVEGPESRVKALAEVSTDPIDAGDLTPDKSLTVNLSVDDPTIRLSSEKVAVHVVASSKSPPPRKSPI